MSTTRPPVIGLVGGIGSGKSEVARLLARLGCAVADSDAHTREILARPAVRDVLVSWWGERVLGAGGTPGTREIDRAAVGRIVFADPEQRTRLERLIHPMVHALRERQFAAARAGSPPPRALVIDAPLLLEAGLDAECDHLVFVDAPHDQRVARVAATRGWGADELARRERAQMPLDAKRARCGIVIGNSDSATDLETSVRRVLDRIEAGGAGGGGGP